MKQFDVSLYLDQINMEVKQEEKQRELEARTPKKYIGSGEDADLYPGWGFVQEEHQ